MTTMSLQSQCVNNPNAIYSFTVNNIPYEIVKENKTWADAASCAVIRGGKLAEIDSKKEQDSVFAYVRKAGIVAANTVAPDGGGASYLWLGGNDIHSEGNWFWDGMDAGSFMQFWQGAANGSPMNGLYTNWGNEPDDFNNQDGLGLAITNWPRGLAGQWNDVNDRNGLYYIIEFSEIVPATLPELKARSFSLTPNPAGTSIVVERTDLFSGRHYTIINQQGAVVLTGFLEAGKTSIDLSSLAEGIYTFLNEEQQACRFIRH